MRPGAAASSPELTNSKYCIFDQAHKDYLCTQEWVDLLTAKILNSVERSALTAAKTVVLCGAILRREMRERINLFNAPILPKM